MPMLRTQTAGANVHWRWTLPSESGTGRFLLHFAEMCLAMEAGMLVFHALPIGNPLRSWVDSAIAPQSYTALSNIDLDVHLLGMWVFMSVPMVVWMRIRGHGWRHGADMAGAMLAPTVVCIGLCWLGLDAILPWLPASTMPAMLLAMLALMLHDRQHYTYAQLPGAGERVRGEHVSDFGGLLARDVGTLALGLVVVVAALVPLRPEFGLPDSVWSQAGYHAPVSADGYQEAMVVVKGGYTPDVIVVQHDQPVRLNFERDEPSTCGAVVVLPQFDTRYYLPEGQIVPVELVPEKTGDFPFTCEMGHYRGHLIVQ
jgi:hypothetical protein